MNRFNNAAHRKFKLIYIGSATTLGNRDTNSPNNFYYSQYSLLRRGAVIFTIIDSVCLRINFEKNFVVVFGVTLVCMHS